jgi:hypothetical protein
MLPPISKLLRRCPGQCTWRGHCARQLTHANAPPPPSPPRCSPCAAQALEEPGQGRVLVVDGGGSKRCALLGDNIAEMAHKNGWSVSGGPCPAAGAAMARRVAQLWGPQALAG